MDIDICAYTSCMTLEDIAKLLHEEGYKCYEDKKIDKVLLDPLIKDWTLNCYVSSVGVGVITAVSSLCQASNGYQVGEALSKLQKAYDTFEATVTNWVVSEMEKIEILEGKEND